MKKSADIEGHSVNLPRPFGVDYVPRKKRVSPDKEGRILVGTVEEIPAGKAKAFALTNNLRIAVFNVAGKFHAVKDACPHAEYPLSKGTLEGEAVTCASHSWKFNVRTGKGLHGDIEKIRTFDVVVRKNELWVKV